MSYIPITPFRRSMNATLIEHEHAATANLPPEGVNKYEVVRELAAARKIFKVTNRELGVLQVLLSFYPGKILDGDTRDLIVFPSNAAICERLNGMPCSTMRRHIAGLVNAGLILRRDSPNGKRYIKRYGDDRQVFGFDLTPLLTRYAEFCELAETVRAEEQQYQRLRRTVSLMRRDLASLATYGSETRPDVPLWDAFSDLAKLTARDLRRNLSLSEIDSIRMRLLSALEQARGVFDLAETPIMSIKDLENEQHIQTSDKDTCDFERSSEIKEESSLSFEPKYDRPRIPLTLVTKACSELETYAPDGIRHWHDLVKAAETVGPMMGVSASAWDEACLKMGPEEAAVVVLAMLERFSEIKSPGGYLRTLSRKAELGQFSCGPMIMALVGDRAA